MLHTVKKIIAITTAILLTFSCAGCNGGEDPTEPITTQNSSTVQGQGTTAPETSTPGTSAPETTVPETTVPATTVPETTAPETTVPEPTAPKTTVPETTVPETTAPETTVPETTIPETTAPVETQPPATQPPATEPEDVVYEEIDAANSVELLESRLHNWPSFGESQTAMTDFTWTYIITTSQTPVCSVRSVEAISATLGGSACEIYQTSTKENAWAIVEKYGAEFAVNTDLITIIQIKSPEVEMDRDADYIDMPLEVILRFTLENGQVMDLRYTDDVIWTGSGGVLMDCKSEDFQ